MIYIMSTKPVPKYRKIKHINRQKFKTLRHKSLLSNSRRKTYRRRDGKSNISQQPFLPSTPPKLHTIFEDESDDDDDDKERTPITIHRRISNDRIKDDIIRQATTRSPRIITPPRTPSLNRTVRVSPPKRVSAVSRVLDRVSAMFSRTTPLSTTQKKYY